MNVGLRHASTQSTTPEEAHKILVEQRKNRPLSPELAIYQPQLTWIMSSFHRITGVALAGGLYAFLIGYVAAPLVGVHFDSATVVNAFAALPLVAKIPLKFIASLPFTFHCANGVRHLIWDTTKELTLKGVYRTGYFVTGFTLLASLVLTFI